MPRFRRAARGGRLHPTNGTTWYDRTNYVETVPNGALDLALFLESDRMGHLLGAVTQDKLDKQRGVVQNEKRQGDNQPYGLVEYAIGEGLFPVGHPYRHATIGSMADLDAASLDDVRQWFTRPLRPEQRRAGAGRRHRRRRPRGRWSKSGSATSRAGPRCARSAAGPVTLAAPARREMTDQVPIDPALSRLERARPQRSGRAGARLGLHVLGGLASSRLDNALVRGEQLAVAVTASAPDLRAGQLPRRRRWT